MQDQDHKRTLILLEDSYTTYYQQVPENQNIYYPNIGIPDVDCVEKPGGAGSWRRKTWNC